MRKGTVAAILALLMMLLCTTAWAEETMRSGNYKYRVLDDGTAEITGYSGNDEALKVPAVLDGRSVTRIGDGAFSCCYSFTCVILPDSLVDIGSNPFSGCGSLREIRVSPDHPVLDVIDGVLFSKADKRLVCYPPALENMEYTVPMGVKIIGDYAFACCESLTGITVPDSVTEIGDYAFAGCALASVTLPDSVTEIGDYAFSDCDALASITLPDSVTEIGDYAFDWCTSLSSITLPDSVTEIGDYAFHWCTSLSSITLPDSVTEIGDYAFSGCDSLASITLPDSVTKIGNDAFSYCDALTSITLPDGVTKIGNDAFYGCDSLASITLPDSVTEIGDYAFFCCKSLTSITLPDSLHSIGRNPFAECVSLREIRVSPDHPALEVIDGVLFSKADNRLVCYPSALDNTVYTVPMGVKIIGDGAFGFCESLACITLPDSVTEIGDNAFFGCESLVSITLPLSVESIGKEAFANCPNLTLTVPRDSYAASYAKENGIPYEYPDSHDWLND